MPQQWTKMTDAERLANFLDRVDRSGDPEGCWLWQGVIARTGYGQVWNGKRMVATHRFSYSQLVGPITGDLMVLHRCDVRLCVNPAHLWLGTQADNMADCSAKGRSPVGTRHPRAHPTATVAAIRAAVASGESQYSVAARFGVSSSTVNRYVHGHRHGLSDAGTPERPPC